MKTALAWVLVVALGAGLGWQISRNWQQEAQIAQLQLALETAKTAETELEASAERVRLADEEIKRLREEQKALLRLRNQVRQLQGDRETLQKQVQSGQNQLEQIQNQAENLQAEAATLRAQTAQAQASAQSNVTAKFMQRYGLKTEDVQANPAQACMNQLRMIEGAKMQWALENSIPNGSSVSMADLKNYMKGPVSCPSGGVYQLNVIGTAATCSVAGHSPPPQ
jgi:uncharacterized protein (DUF3084 family)